jgi:oligo-1,6-glucosidase
MTFHSQHQDISTVAKWWKEQIVYQIYPRSFKDSNGTGVGDLRGIISKLDYIKSLGIDAVWINPIYASPNDDNGYDISDYRAIMTEFGNMDDFDELLAGLHKAGIKFIMDLVVNHTSDEHYWFSESRSSRDNPYRDYYHWWPAEKGKPPFRWSYFDEKGEAWKYDAQTDAYYLHYFTQKQPDLNWENPKVRQEVFDVMKFWAQKGVDGFRLDAFQFVSKDTTFPKLPDSYERDSSQIIKYHGMGENIHVYLKEMYDQVLSRYDVFAVSEGAGSNFEDAHMLVDEDRNELQMAYHFECVDMNVDVDNGHTLLQFKHLHSAWDASFAEKGWISIYLANHDQPRMVSKFGNDSPEFRDASAKMLNTFILTMRGTPYCYFGDELGMTNIDFTDIKQYRDVAAINGYKKVIHDGKDPAHYLRHLRAFSRDHSRTPMLWDSSTNAGFSSAKPWLPVNQNYTFINASQQQSDANSVLNHFRTLTKLRKENEVLVYGDYTLLFSEHEHVYAYTRTLNDEQILIVLNFCEHPQTINLSDEAFEALPSSVVINNYPDFTCQDTQIMLLPYQAIVLK